MKKLKAHKIYTTLEEHTRNGRNELAQNKIVSKF